LPCLQPGTINTQITKELKITPILDKLLEYKRYWIQHVNRMPRNGLPRVLKHYSEGIMADFWICETGTSQQVAQLHDRYMMIMMMMKSEEEVNFFSIHSDIMYSGM
jgi:hypothetical protein